MNIGINPKSGIILVALITLLIGGLAYALSAQRTISGSAVVGQVQTAEDTILLWESLDPKVPRGPVSFGNLQSPARFPVWVENGGGTPFSLTVEAANIMVTMPGTGSAPMDDALRILFGPAGGDLRPAPDHAVMIDPTTPPPPLEGVGFVGQGPNGEPSDFGPADAAPGVIAVAANGERIAVVGDNIGDTFTVALQGNPISTVGGQNFTPLTDRDGSGTVTTADLEIVIPVVAAGDLRPGETAIAAGDINIDSLVKSLCRSN